LGARLQKLNPPGNKCHPSLPTYWSHFTNPTLTTAFRKEEEEKKLSPSPSLRGRIILVIKKEKWHQERCCVWSFSAPSQSLVVPKAPHQPQHPPQWTAQIWYLACLTACLLCQTTAQQQSQRGNAVLVWRRCWALKLSASVRPSRVVLNMVSFWMSRRLSLSLLSAKSTLLLPLTADVSAPSFNISCWFSKVTFFFFCLIWFVVFCSCCSGH